MGQAWTIVYPVLCHLINDMRVALLFLSFYVYIWCRGPGTYKIPAFNDVPRDFRVHLSGM